MGTDLNAPIGKDRKPASGRKEHPGYAKGLLAAFSLVVIAGLSIFAITQSSGLRVEAPEETVTEPATAPSSETVAGQSTGDDSAQTQETSLRRRNGLSGARVDETLTDDGNVVRTYSPRSRDGEGPVIISTDKVRGQAPRMAAMPNDDLLEDSPFGRLPVTGPDGFRPMDQYARPWSGARGTRIALVVGGLGLSQTGTQHAIRELPEEITLAFAASGNSLQRWMQEARRGGHEILLQIPFEPFDYPANDPGPDTLLVSTSATENLDALHEAMARITNYTGIMNFLGGRFLADAGALEPVMRDLAERGLLFLDDGTSAQSLTGTLASTLNAPHAFADLVLDAQLDRRSILAKLDDLERIAKRNGTAIGVASAFDESVAAIAEWSREASARGIEIVGVSAIAEGAVKQ